MAAADLPARESVIDRKRLTAGESKLEAGAGGDVAQRLGGRFALHQTEAQRKRLSEAPFRAKVFFQNRTLSSVQRRPQTTNSPLAERNARAPAQVSGSGQ